MIKNYRKKYVMDLYSIVTENPRLTVATTVNSRPDRRLLKTKKEALTASLYDYYRTCDNIILKWQPSLIFKAEHGSKVNFSGCIDLASLNDLFILQNRNELLNLQSGQWTFHGEETTDLVNNGKGQFRVLDRLASKAVTGYLELEGKDKNDTMYLHDPDGKCYSLNVDFEGYFELLCASYGFQNWQYAVLFKEYGVGEAFHNDFKESMPLLFPDFSYEEFIKLYESLKLN